MPVTVESTERWRSDLADAILFSERDDQTVIVRSAEMAAIARGIAANLGYARVIIVQEPIGKE